jgi:hypothetical protein
MCCAIRNDVLLPNVEYPVMLELIDIPFIEDPAPKMAFEKRLGS